MNRCFQLASLANGATRTNPMVGAILVYNNQIIGEGYHEKYGEAHAEVNCIKSIAYCNIDKIRHSTLYVSLEPCTFHGKTPACTDLILEHKIPKVVIGSEDFNPKVASIGIRILLQAGVEVINLDWKQVQLDFNRHFYNLQIFKRPLFIAKYAQTNNGFIGIKKEVLKITSLEVDTIMHQLRGEVDAILIGKHTLINDKPLLTTRYVKGNDALMIVLDSHPDINDYLYLKGRPVLVINELLDEKLDSIVFKKISNCREIKTIVDVFYSTGLSKILIEGGTQIIESFAQADMIDSLIQITNLTMNIQDGIKAPEIDLTGFELKKSMNISNQYIHFYNN